MVNRLSAQKRVRPGAERHTSFNQTGRSGSTTTAPDSTFGPANDVVRAFTPAGKAHDYGYDLLRLARYGFAGLSGDSFVDRTDTDAMLDRFMGDVCARTGYFGWFDKQRCQLNRASVYVAVRARTSIERDPEPSHGLR